MYMLFFAKFFFFRTEALTKIQKLSCDWPNAPKSIECKALISVKCRVLFRYQNWQKVAVCKNLFVELKITWFDCVIWQSELKMHREQGQIKKLSSKAKRQGYRRFPMMWILKEEYKFMNSAVKFKCWIWKLKSCSNWKFKPWILAGIVPMSFEVSEVGDRRWHLSTS